MDDEVEGAIVFVVGAICLVALCTVLYKVYEWVSGFVDAVARAWNAFWGWFLPILEVIAYGVVVLAGLALTYYCVMQLLKLFKFAWKHWKAYRDKKRHLRSPLGQLEVRFAACHAELALAREEFEIVEASAAAKRKSSEIAREGLQSDKYKDSDRERFEKAAVILDTEADNFEAKAKKIEREFITPMEADLRGIRKAMEILESTQEDIDFEMIEDIVNRSFDRYQDFKTRKSESDDTFTDAVADEIDRTTSQSGFDYQSDEFDRKMEMLDLEQLREGMKSKRN